MTNDNRAEVRRLQEVVVWLARQPDRKSLLASGTPQGEVNALAWSWALAVPGHFTQTLSDALTAIDEAEEAFDGIGQKDEGGCRDA